MIENALAANHLATADVENTIEHLGEIKELAAMKTEHGTKIAERLKELEELPSMDYPNRAKAKRRAETSVKQAMESCDRAWDILEKGKPEIVFDPVQGRFQPGWKFDGSTPPPVQ